MAAKKKTTTSTKGKNKYAGFSDEEKAAMKEYAKELKRQEKIKNDREANLKDLMEKIAEMEEPERSMAKRLHKIITTTAPDLMPKTWYGMPAYANQDGKVVCHFQSASKFNTRYATLGFSEHANLDQGVMWPVAFSLVKMTAAEEKKIAALVKKAVS
jgi:uncharacterized protein YdhG (YjbR/CyaY superfamily)